jgi:hypothetical protein
MTKEHAKKILDSTKRDYTIKHCVLKGLQIFARYNEDETIAFLHDVIYAEDFEDSLKHLTEEELQELAKMSWIVDEETETWCHF